MPKMKTHKASLKRLPRDGHGQTQAPAGRQETLERSENRQTEDEPASAHHLRRPAAEKIRRSHGPGVITFRLGAYTSPQCQPGTALLVAVGWEADHPGVGCNGSRTEREDRHAGAQTPPQIDEGFRLMGRHNLYRQSRMTLVRRRVYAFRDRRVRKREFRRLWIVRINAACRMRGTRLQRVDRRACSAPTSNSTARAWQRSPSTIRTASPRSSNWRVRPWRRSNHGIACRSRTTSLGRPASRRV